jgi:hypothetical protein
MYLTGRLVLLAANIPDTKKKIKKYRGEFLMNSIILLLEHGSFVPE